MSEAAVRDPFARPDTYTPGNHRSLEELEAGEPVIEVQTFLRGQIIGARELPHPREVKRRARGGAALAAYGLWARRGRGGRVGLVIGSSGTVDAPADPACLSSHAHALVVPVGDVYAIQLSPEMIVDEVKQVLCTG